MNLEGRVLELSPTVLVPEGIRPYGAVLAALAEKLGQKKPAYAELAGAQAEIGRRLSGFPAFGERLPLRPIAVPAAKSAPKPAVPAGDGERPYLLHWRADSERYLGLPLAGLSAGFASLADRGRLLVSPAVAQELALVPGRPVEIGGADFVLHALWREVEGLPGRAVHLLLAAGPFPDTTPCPVWIRSAHE